MLTQPFTAQVLIDGVNVRELNLPWLRQQMALVSQEPALFTVRTSCMHRAYITRSPALHKNFCAHTHEHVRDLQCLHVN